VAPTGSPRTSRTSDMPGPGEMPYSGAETLFGAFRVVEPHPDVAEFPRCHSDVREVEPPSLLECAQRLFRCARCHLSWRWRNESHDYACDVWPCAAVGW
jgi:hypothetical protein